MRTTDELVAAVQKRAGELEREKAARRARVFALGLTAACLALIVGASFAMPDAMERLAGGEYAYSGPAASVLAGSPALGFIVIGVLAFALGVCLTILCYTLHRRKPPDGENGHD